MMDGRPDFLFRFQIIPFVATKVVSLSVGVVYCCALKQFLMSVVREIRTLGSVGTGGG